MNSTALAEKSSLFSPHSQQLRVIPPERAMLWCRRNVQVTPSRFYTFEGPGARRRAEACALAMNGALRLAGIYDPKGPAFFITLPS